jgi:putative tricarboxylic transport membrane protein
MRRAEIVMAGLMAALSIYLMWKSAELPIGWIDDEGPGGGAFSFWLAAIMLGCTVWIMINWVRRSSPPSRSTVPFMTRDVFKRFGLVAGALTAMVALVQVIGMYGVIPLFLVFYIRFLGRHSWPTTLAIAVAAPIATFFFFDVALRIVLPKGYLEPLFLPLYDVFL